MFGGGAIGGVVNIITRKGGAVHAQATARRRRPGTGPVATNGAGRRGGLWGGAFERLPPTAIREFDESIGNKVTNDDYEAQAHAGFGWSDRATSSVRIDGRFGRDERGISRPYGSDPEGNFVGLDTVSRGINHRRGFAGSGPSVTRGGFVTRVQFS